MENSEQINLKISKNLLEAAKKYAEMYGYRNIQELANESIREKVFEDNEFDETFNEEEIELIDSLIRNIIQNKNFGTKEELDKILKNEL